MGEKDFVIIDGNSLMNKAFYALPPLTNKKGVITNAVYGFCTMFFKIMDEIKPRYIAVAFDKKAPTFRHVEYKDYKAHRKGMPDELAAQVPILKEVLKAFNIRILEVEGYEADDIIGTLAERFKKHLNVIVVTGDRDALQLASDNVRIFISRKGITDVEEYGEKEIMEKYGISPSQIVDMKALMGDSSDNIPGVPGIGEKTALKLIKEFHSVENLLDNLEKVGSEKLRLSLMENRDMAILSKKLAKIDVGVPFEIKIEELEIGKWDIEKLYALFYELEFKSLLERLPALEEKNTAAEIKTDFKRIEISDLEDIVKNIRRFSVEVNLHEPYISVFNPETGCLFIQLTNDKNSCLQKLKFLLEDPNILKICHDVKDKEVALKNYGIEFKGLAFDTAIAAYLLNPTDSDYSVEIIAKEYLDVLLNKNSSDLEYISNKLHIIYKLGEIFFDKLKELDLDRLYFEVELPLVEVLADMEYNGFKVDEDKLEELSFEFGKKIDALTKEIYRLAGTEFNINSPKQLAFILFEKLGLPAVKKTKTGYSTSAEVLEELLGKHEIIEKILEYRQVVKLKTTYVDGLLSIMDKNTHRVHTSFKQTVTATGRISSTEPNLQNIPIRMDLGKEIRKVFIPSDEEHLLLCADYSQIDLRVLAHLSQDPNLVDAFKHGQDIHARTASEIFGIPIEKVDSNMRRIAKTVNFGIIYGMSDFGLAKELKISKTQAREYIENYFNKYSGVKRFMNETIRFAEENGYVSTILNRRRYLPELRSKNKNLRAMGERIAMNTPIQGSSADIIKVAMVNIYKEFKKNNLKSKLILQVHDELIFDVYKDELEEVRAIVKYHMENAVKLSVPLVVDINVGESWYHAK